MSACPPDALALLSLADGDRVPADALARCLEGLQALVRALAAAPPKRPPVLHAWPVDGGLALAIGGRQLALDLGLGASAGERGERLLSAIAAAEDAPALAALVPDPVARARVRAALRRAAPRPSERWTLVLTPPDGAPVRLGPRQAAVLAADAPEKGPPVRMTLVGELTAVDFTTGRLTLRLPATGQAIAGPYPPALEVKLLKHRRKVVLLTGDFALDAAGAPRALRHAVDLLALDLGPIRLDAVDLPGGALPLVPPLTLVPTLDAETGQRFVAQDPLLELHVAADSRDELEAALRAEIARRWSTYARPGHTGGDAALARRWRRLAAAGEREPRASGIT